MIKSYIRIKKWFIGDYIHNHQDVFSAARAELLFNTVFGLVLISIPLVIDILMEGLYVKAFQSFIGLIGVFSFLFILKIGQNTFWPSLMIMILTNLVIPIGFVFNKENFHLKELFWMVNLIVFAIFMLGIRWGFLFFGILMICLGFYMLKLVENDLILFHHMKESQKALLGVEISVALLFFIYLISFFVITYKRSERALLYVNKNLEKQNELVVAQNQEITMLLKEIHHRVKNNLQVINSLLSLQSIQIKDKESKRVFEDAQNRIRAISMIHERMYKSPDLSAIKANDYFNGLIEDLFRQNLVNHEVDLKLDINLTSLPQDSVVPLGLLLNELLSNSMKHACMENDGEIVIKIIEENRILYVEYLDNGQGFDVERESGFGLEMIDTLCEQLNAEMTLKTSPQMGVHYSFESKMH